MSDGLTKHQRYHARHRVQRVTDALARYHATGWKAQMLRRDAARRADLEHQLEELHAQRDAARC